MKIRFHPRALAQLEEIWNYSVEKWGENQADLYIAGLHHQIQQALTTGLQRQKLPFQVETSLELRITRYKRHYIFVVVESNSIKVIGILHDSMNLPQRLREALR